VAELSAAAVGEQLLPATRNRMERLEVLASVDSTNAYLRSQTPPRAANLSVAVANEQTAGRGRGDNRWHSPPGGLWLSVAYTFEAQPEKLSALTLALGAQLAEKLRELGVTDVALKWPNDLFVGDRKLGGILVETTASGKGVVCGVGINLATPSDHDLAQASSFPPFGLSEWLESPVDRTALLADVIDCCAGVLTSFENEGFAPWHELWSRFDWLQGRAVTVTGAQPAATGIAQGIDDDGALLLLDNGQQRRVLSGSIRLSSGET